MKPESSQHRQRRPVRALLLLTQPTLLALIVVVVCLQWRVPTLIHLEGIVPWNDAFVDKEEIQGRIASGEFFPTEVRHIVIRYPEYPEMSLKRAMSSATLFLRPVDAIHVEKFSPDLLQQEVQISLAGQVTQISLRQERQSYDYRLTLFDRLKHSSYALVAGIALWLGLTAAGWMNVYHELKRAA